MQDIKTELAVFSRKLCMKTNDKVYANLVCFGNKPRKPLPRKALLVQTLHGGEQQAVADGGGVGQEHGHAVDAEAEDGLTGHQGTKPSVAQGFSRF